MSDPDQPGILTPTDDPETLEESLHEARQMLEDALDQVAEAAYTIGAIRGLLPTTPEGDVEFDEDDLKKTNHPTLLAIAAIAEAIYAALETLPAGEDEDEDDDEVDDEGEE